MNSKNKKILTTEKKSEISINLLGTLTSLLFIGLALLSIHLLDIKSIKSQRSSLTYFSEWAGY